MPPGFGEADDPATAHRDAFGDQQLGFQMGRAAESPETPAGSDHPVVGQAGFIRPAHDLSDGPGGSRPAGPLGDIARGGDTARRNAPEHVQHFAREGRGSHAR